MKPYDEYIATSDTTTPFIEMHGPITRSRSQLHHQINLIFVCLLMILRIDGYLMI
jgi:hypothetical protein